MLGGCGGGAACDPGATFTAYVDYSKGNNATGVVNNQCFPFKSLQAAHDALPGPGNPLLPPVGGVINIAPGATLGGGEDNVVVTKAVRFVGAGGGLNAPNISAYDTSRIGSVTISAASRVSFDNVQIATLTGIHAPGGTIGAVTLKNVQIDTITLDRVGTLLIIDSRVQAGVATFANIGRFELYSTTFPFNIQLSYDASDPEAPVRQGGLLLLAGSVVGGLHDTFLGGGIQLSGQPFLFIDEDSLVFQLSSSGLTVGPGGEVLRITCHGQIGKLGSACSLVLTDIPSDATGQLDFSETTFACVVVLGVALPITQRVLILAHAARWEMPDPSSYILGDSIDVDARNSHFVDIVTFMFFGSHPNCGLDRDYHQSDIAVAGASSVVLIDPPLPPYAVAGTNGYSVTALLTSNGAPSVPYSAPPLTKLRTSFTIDFVPAIGVGGVFLDVTFKRTDRHLPPPV